MEVTGSAKMLVMIYQTTWCHMPEDNIVICLLKAGIAEPEEMALARERLCKHISTATNSRDCGNRYLRNNRGTVGSNIFYAIRADVI
jgi:hypothetical protein